MSGNSKGIRYHVKRLLAFVGEYKTAAILTPILVVAEVVFEVLIPLLMADMVDIGIPLAVETGSYAFILRRGALMLCMALLSMLLGGLNAVLGSKASNGLARNLRTALFEKIENFSFQNIDKFSTPSLITRLTQDITYIQQSFMMSMRMMMRSPSMLILATVFATRISGKLSLILLTAIPVLACSIGLLALKIFPRFEEMLKRYDSLNASAQENLIAIRVVKAFVRGKHEAEKFAASAEGVRRAQLRAERLLILNMPIMQLVMYACIVAVVWFGGKDIVYGTLESGALMSFISYISSILISLMMISIVFINMVLSAASARRVVEVLDEQPALDENLSSEVQLEDNSIEYRNVSFTYTGDPNNLILEDVNLSVRPGEVIGILGGSGSGKTSLVQLVPRLYDVYGGELFVGGHNVKDYSTQTLRGAVGMVLQKNVLFSGTIRENLLWGNEHATDEQIERACRAACAYEFVTEFPDGFETDLGQGGVNVSGGQKQRLCIARALLKEPRILILDDSTSAVDTETDASIRQAFRTWFPETTKLIIAQRVNSVMDADRIVVLEDGRIHAVGTHEELLASDPIYQEVYHSQQKGVE